MKGNARFELDERWWKKEAPKEVQKIAPKFEKALKEFSTADDGLNMEADDSLLSDAELAELARAAKLLDAVQTTGAELLKDVEKLADGEDDKERRKALEGAAEALKKALPKAIEEKRQEYDGYDGDAKKSPLVSPDAHTAYLKRMLPRVKRMEHNFAFALVSNDPDDQRFLFSMKKGAKSLATSIRGDTRPRSVTWGRAIGGANHGDGRHGNMTLVLILEGKKVPGLARRVRFLFQALGISLFNKCVVVQDGEEDVSDEAEAETPLGELPEEEAGEETGDAPPRAQPAPAARPVPPLPERAPRRARDPQKLEWLALRKAVAPKLERAVAERHGDPKLLQKYRTIWLKAQEIAGTGKYAKAIKAAQAVTQFLADYAPPPEDAAARWARKRRKLYPAMVARLRAGEADPARCRAAWALSEVKHAEGDDTGALAALNDLARLLAGAGAAAAGGLLPRGGAELADDLRERLAVLTREADALLPDLQDPLRERFDRERAALESAIGSAVAAAGQGAGGRAAAAAERDLAHFERTLEDARRAAGRAARRFGDLRREIAALDARVDALAHRAEEEALSAALRAAAAARRRLLPRVRRADLYGCLARLPAYAGAVEALERAAEREGAPLENA